MKKYFLFSILITLLYSEHIHSQHNNSELPTSINQDGSAPDSSAILDLQSSNKGLLIPRLNRTARDLIGAPATGLLIYQTDSLAGFYYFNGVDWMPITGQVSGDDDPTNELNLSASLNGLNLELVDAGGKLVVDLSSLQDGVDDADNNPVNEIQDLKLSGDILIITNNGSATDIDLTPYLDNTDTQLAEAEVDSLVGNNGYLTMEIDGDASNEIQDLDLSGNILTITKNGSATDIDLTPYLDNTDTQLTEAEVDSLVGNNGYLTMEIDGDVSNEIQDLDLSGNILTITKNGSATDIDLTPYLDNTDTQLTEAEVDSMVSNNGYITSPDDGDPDPTNEYNTSVNLNGTNLEIVDGGGTISTDLSGFRDSIWTQGVGLVYNLTDNIGIGTTTPSAGLVLTGTDQNSSRLVIGNNQFNQTESGRLSFHEDSDDISTNFMCGFEFRHDGIENKLHLESGCGPVGLSRMTVKRTGEIGIGTTDPLVNFHVAGKVRFDDLAAGGIVQAETNGNLNIIADSSAIAGDVLTYDGANWTIGPSDNLGNHTATENIQLNGHWLSNDGGNEGIFVNGQGNVGIDTKVPGAQFRVTQDLDATQVMDTLVHINQNGPSSYCLYVENDSEDPFTSYGIYNKTNSGFDGGVRYGLYNTMTPASTDGSSYYGCRSIINSGGSSTGSRYGFYSTITASGSSSSSVYGLRSFISGGTGTKYGVYSSMSSGTGNNYGVYATISGTSGTQYGVYANADGATNYAGYFIGRGYFSENVGIHKSSPNGDFSLHIKQVASNHGIRIEHQSNTNAWNLGIGLNSNNFRFEYNDFGRSQIDNVTGEYSLISDRRLKANIEPMENVLEKVLLLNPALYHYKEAQDVDKSRGFIAQEVAEIFPDIVRIMDADNEGESPLHVIAYDDFAVLAIKAIQEQQEIIESLKLNIAAQNVIISNLQAQAEKMTILETSIKKIQRELAENK